MSQEVTLFDLPSRPPCKSWSLNPWKTRLYLNYKQIPYKTQWIEYPDIAPTLSPHVERNPPGMFAPYTIPAVTLPDGTWMQDSAKIAAKLEELYPSPALKLDGEYIERVYKATFEVGMAAAPAYLDRMPKRLLNERSSEWWYPDREGRIGKKLDQLQAETPAAKITQATAAPMKMVADMLKENPSGPFFEGTHLTYADFVWAAFLHCYKRVGDDVYDIIVTEDRDMHAALLEACKPWMERDDH